MTLDEAIQHCEITAKSNEKLAEFYYNRDPDKIDQKSGDACQECAAEHRQLAGWLKELKQYREGTLLANDWIPVSERLPEMAEFYLTSIKWDDDTERVTISWFDGMSFKVEVKAWMPLPEPYKAESEISE